MGWFIAAALVVLLLAVLPLGASVCYDEAGPQVRILAGPLKIKIFPLPRKKKKPKAEPKEKKPKQEKPKKASKPVSTVPKGGSWTDFLPLVRLALDMLNDLRLKLRVDHLMLHLTMAGDDPCDLAVNYGRMNAAMAGLLAQLERFLVIKKRDVCVNCDFTASNTVVLARLDLTITLGRIVSIGVRYGVRALKMYLNITKQQEGGADL